MAKVTKQSNRELAPDPRNGSAFKKWLFRQPRQWLITIAVRAALRVLPLMGADEKTSALLLPVLRAAAIARFAAKYSNRAIAAAAADAAQAAHVVHVTYRAAADADVHAAAYAAAAAYATVGVADATYAASADSATAAYVTAAAADAITASAIMHDAQRLLDRSITVEQLAGERLWPQTAPPKFTEAWLRLKRRLHADGRHWQVWIDWYENGVLHEPYHSISEVQEAAFTELPGELPWDDGAEAVNTVIARRLRELSLAANPGIPEQVDAPVRVEERGGKIAKVTDRDSSLNAAERDFKAWRDAVVEHIEELTASDFAAGTNHSRVRERLMKLGKFLPGEVSEVKENQFKIGYEIDRFEGLMAAYRTGGEDMPALNAAQLEDIERLRVALRMGVDKLERWSEFRKQANESTTGEADADREVVGSTLDEMAAVMEQRPHYFEPQLPATFRFLSESVRDPLGATKTIVFGAIKSVENLVSFLGQRALGVGKKGAEAVETHISKAVATALVASLGGAALELSGALPQGWAWLKPLLTALGVGG